jgi:ketosteroid isomerase-like protein
MPDIFAVGQRLVELCREKKNMQAVDELYSPDIVSIETHDMPNMPARMQGIEKIRGKNRWWFEQHDIHGVTVNGPWPHGERFITTWRWDVTAKAGPFAGKRMQHEEAALYTVKDGKIVQEEFFYHMG